MTPERIAELRNIASCGDLVRSNAEAFNEALDEIERLQKAQEGYMERIAFLCSQSKRSRRK